MIYEVILVGMFGLLIGGILGYSLGRYQNSLIDIIQTLTHENQIQEIPKPEPTVTGGAYAPPREVSTSVEKKQGAGLVETKTPELLDWENKNEIENLSKI